MEQETIDIVVSPPMSSTPINEYTTEGLFYMAFPTLFPNGTALPMQPRAREVKIHEYDVHLIHYHDNRFGQHPRFRYFLLNLMMRHRSQSTASVFIKRKVEDNTPSTIEDLRSHLTNLHDNQLAEELMHFWSTLRGTRAFWNTRRTELTSLITQIGSPTFFFTLSAIDTK